MTTTLQARATEEGHRRPTTPVTCIAYDEKGIQVTRSIDVSVGFDRGVQRHNGRLVGQHNGFFLSPSFTYYDSIRSYEEHQKE